MTNVPFQPGDRVVLTNPEWFGESPGIVRVVSGVQGCGASGTRVWTENLSKCPMCGHVFTQLDPLDPEHFRRVE